MSTIVILSSQQQRKQQITLIESYFNSNTNFSNKLLLINSHSSNVNEPSHVYCRALQSDFAKDKPVEYSVRHAFEEPFIFGILCWQSEDEGAGVGFGKFSCFAEF